MPSLDEYLHRNELKHYCIIHKPTGEYGIGTINTSSNKNLQSALADLRQKMEAKGLIQKDEPFFLDDLEFRYRL